MVNVDVQVKMTLKYGFKQSPASPPGLNRINRIKRSSHIMIVSLMHFINVFHRQVRKTYNDI